MKRITLLMAIGLIGTLLSIPLKTHAETVTLVYNTNSGIANARYTATLADGTILGFYNYSNAYFCGAISEKTSLSVPDSVIYNSTKYSVRYIGYNRLDFDKAQSITSLTLPPTITNLSYLASTVKTLHVNSYITNVYTGALSNLDRVMVPASTLASYLGNTNWYRYVLINEEGTKPIKVTINMTKAGEFAQLLLEKTNNNWMMVNELTVTGELNTDDLNVFKRMKQLTVLDLSGATIASIPNSFDENSYGFGVLETLKLPNLNTIGDYAFQYCSKLTSVSLPKVNTIGHYAFQYCTKLRNITLPDGITAINYGAFQGSGLRSITIPKTITTISDYCFDNCTALASANIPSSITTIGSYAFQSTALTSIDLPGVQTINSSAFQNCTKLKEIKFSNSLKTFNGTPFYGCTALTEIDLPSSMTEVNSAAFQKCTGIKKVICRAVTPPTHGSGNALLYGCDMTNVVLYVPAMSIDNYRAQNGWKTFYTIQPMEDKLTWAHFYDTVTIDDASLFASGCDFLVGYMYQYRNGTSTNYCGNVYYNGNSTLSLGNYKQYIHMGKNGSTGQPYSNGGSFSSLIPNGPMRANTVKMILRTESNSVWYFFTLPYDVKVSDISYTDGVQFVIRRYSGLNRAQSQSNTWQNLTADSIMHAHQGYILKCNSSNLAKFIFPAINNANKNKIFEKNDAVVALGEYLSEFEHNRSWNLIGNPYPCFYDIRFMDFTAPITLWNRYYNRYDAYSPVDDSYVLRPTQAFFVQRPVDRGSITFNKEGRQTNATPRALKNMPRRFPANRQLYNVYLTCGENEDHTRFVFNDEAARSYELDKDASKLIADGNTSMLLYTVEDGVKYAINERDYDNGIVYLGFYAPTDGEYHLSLDANSAETITLIDNEKGTRSSMQSEYVFKAKAGYNDARFALEFGQTGIREVSNDNMSINVNDGILSSNVRCDVYSIDGRWTGTCDANNTISLEKGIYVIHGNKVTRKIIVK